MGICERNSPADNKVSAEGRPGGALAPEQRFLPAHGEAAVPLQTMEVQRGVQLFLQPLEESMPQ